jgi:hypothetical protein
MHEVEEDNIKLTNYIRGARTQRLITLFTKARHKQQQHLPKCYILNIHYSYSNGNMCLYIYESIPKVRKILKTQLHLKETII